MGEQHYLVPKRLPSGETQLVPIRLEKPIGEMDKRELLAKIWLVEPGYSIARLKVSCKNRLGRILAGSVKLEPKG